MPVAPDARKFIVVELVTEKFALPAPEMDNVKGGVPPTTVKLALCDTTTF